MNAFQNLLGKSALLGKQIPARYNDSLSFRILGLRMLIAFSITDQDTH